MQRILLLCVLLGLALAITPSVREQFVHFQTKFHKIYANGAEFNKRFAIFQENMKLAEELNRLNPNARFGVTKYSDLSRKEFASMYLMPNFNTSAWVRPPVKVFGQESRQSSTDVDWRNSGAITPVYDQGQCGSCWAFSATETIESYTFLGGKPLQQMSMEQIVDCDTTDQGCNGGFPQDAYAYVQSAGGIDSYSSYPYTAGNGQAGQCNFNSANVVSNVQSTQTISGEDGLYKQSATYGPVSVCVDASTWQTYQSGILTSCGNQVDHCVQLVGFENYGSSNAAWIVRNSWNTNWGENGYIRIAIGQDLCSIGDYATVVQAGN